MPPLSQPLEIVIWAFCACLCGLAGGYGGLKLLARQTRRDVLELVQDLESFDIRLKKFEGRKTRERANEPTPPKEVLELASLLRRGPVGVPQQHDETEGEIVARAFAHSPTKVSGE